MLRGKPNHCLGLRFLDHLSRAKVAKEDTQWREGILLHEEAGAVKSESNLKASNWKGSEKTEVGEPRSQGKTDTTSVLF